MKSVIAFLKDESGQTTVEYVLLLVVAAVLVFKFKGIAEDGIDRILPEVYSIRPKVSRENQSIIPLYPSLFLWFGPAFKS